MTASKKTLKDLCKEFEIPDSQFLGLAPKKFMKDMGEVKKINPDVLIWDDIYLTKNKSNSIELAHHRIPLVEDFPESLPIQKGLYGIRKDLYQKDFEGLSEHELYLSLKSKSKSLKFLKLNGVYRFLGHESIEAYNFEAGDEFLKKETPLGKVSVIINFYNKADMTVECLRKVLNQEKLASLEIILVNNNSSSDSVEKVKKFLESQNRNQFSFKILDYPKEYNHSAQTNLAVENATGDIFVMLNNDCMIQSPNTLYEIAILACNPFIATASPKIVDDKGNLVSVGMRFYRLGNKAKGFDKTVQEAVIHPMKNTLKLTLGSTFACCAIERKKWDKIGGMDETNFPTIYNDADFCLKATQLGFHHCCNGRVEVVHNPGTSDDNRSKDFINKFKTALYDKYEGLDSFIGKGTEKDFIDEKIEWGNFLSVSTHFFIRIFRKIGNITKLNNLINSIIIKISNFRFKQLQKYS